MPVPGIASAVAGGLRWEGSTTARAPLPAEANACPEAAGRPLASKPATSSTAAAGVILLVSRFCLSTARPQMPRNLDRVK